MEQHQIRKLNDNLINKIAAGEVIERPSSVVKELVENSLDAGSTKIKILLKEGGKKLIQITDNGSGIIPSDLELAVSRHATSKIQDFDDLYKLHTKGFRGEALASIASVSQMSVTSKSQEFEAKEITIHGGKMISIKDAAHEQGTTISVKYLFYQTPARLKFLRRPETETSHIVNIVTKLALSHPHVEFQVLQNNKVIFEAPCFDNELDRIVGIIGKEFREYLFPFFVEENGMKMWGYFGHPQVSRSQRNMSFFFVNGRTVSDKVIWHAVIEAHRDLLMKGKYPVMVLNLLVDERTLDVNVHPTKSEVRFHQSSQVHQFICHGLRQHLQESPWLKKHKSFETQESEFSETHHVQNLASSTEDTASDFSLSKPSLSFDKIQNNLQNWSGNYFENKKSFPEPVTFNKEAQNTFSHYTKTPNQKHIHFGKTIYSDMNPLSQLLGTYILCEANDRLILIDQHAAHERIGFEKLMLQFQKGSIPTQPLLVPETFDLKASDTEIFKGYLDELKDFGFEIDFFGGNTFVLKSMPILLEGKINFRHFISNLIDDIKETGELISLKDKLHHVLATMACHGQIRAHHNLSREEMSALLKELDEYQFTDFCPHGRPVSIEVSLEEIEKWFKRAL